MLGQVGLFFVSIVAIYLLIRFGADIPPAGSVAINVAVVVGFIAAARYLWRARRAPREAAVPALDPPPAVKAGLAAALVLGLILPILLVLYFVWLGGRLWR